MEEIIIRKADKKDLKLYHNIIVEICEWFKQKNIKQWDENYPKKFSLEYFEKSIEKDDIFVATKGDEIVGGMLLRNEDIYYSRVGNAYYIHHLATKIGVPKVGDKLIDCALEYSKKNNKKYLRLDCISTNEKLNNYYLNKGFIHTDTQRKFENFYNLYEKEVI